MADEEKSAGQQQPADERLSSEVAMQSLESAETNRDVELLQGGLWQTVAMAIGFAISIPLYLMIEQAGFVDWAAAAILSNLIQPQLRRRHHAKAT
ncbi:MAG TPA: hypothetical protein VI074_14035 [Propionibacteriaceae bacterium]